ncbi:MAG TPA: transcription elongation factor GreA [Deltaproteobacteria bacterium]|jgi:transcription elongation factor GreA|nr:transcription elongation factor GreA [Deltaproteobacteria bacterium]HIJ76253.1 transcription elongation factor GreA [Deltaproteobacteria bacterium]
MKPKVPITRNGYRRLIRELSHLRRIVRPEVLDELREARGYGVKIENQQYLVARERHAILQKKINDLEEKLAGCEIFVGRKFFFKQVGFGTVITIKNLQSGEINRFQIVGPWESDVSGGKLSIDSPVGKGVMGHREGDEVLVYTPSGTRFYRVLSIEI